MTLTFPTVSSAAVRVRVLAASVCPWVCGTRRIARVVLTARRIPFMSHCGPGRARSATSSSQRRRWGHCEPQIVVNFESRTTPFKPITPSNCFAGVARSGSTAGTVSRSLRRGRCETHSSTCCAITSSMALIWAHALTSTIRSRPPPRSMALPASPIHARAPSLPQRPRKRGCFVLAGSAWAHPSRRSPVH